ncbi:MAG: type II toxin-antitoxin system HicB family antitoxin [Gemmatimonadetes bacterium]|jgi:predicted HicB family RNase H-like nuclease|nr:type II toxin-antitoxin system HicB family antitoxin [Gemmatimonadota bacterium]
MMTYRGYPASIEYDAESRHFYGEVVGTVDTIGFEGTSVEELEASFERVIDEYLQMCAEDGREPDRPYSGSIFIRTDPGTHRAVEAAAKASGQSINQWAQAALVEKLAG